MQIVNNNNLNNNKTNIFFNDLDCIKTVIITYTNDTLDNVVKKYLCRINRQDLLNDYKTKIKFTSNGKLLNSHFNKTIQQINLMNKLIHVNYSFKLL